jgi:hypothetical protein
VTQVQRERGCDGVAEPVLNRDAKDHTGAAPPVEVVREEMRRQRRQNVLHRAVLVDVPGYAQRGEFLHLFGACDRAAEDQDR